MIDDIESTEDSAKLVCILASRDILRPNTYPYKAKIVFTDHVEQWLVDNCQGLYRITARYNNGYFVHFEDGNDFTLYTLTWIEQ